MPDAVTVRMAREEEREEDGPAMLQRAWAKRWRHFRVAEAAGALAGFYSLGDEGDDEENNYLWHLYVDPAWHRRGVGTALNRAALDEIASRGAATAWLDVLAKNTKALQFYRALGWHEIGPDLEDPALVLMDIATR